MVRVQPEKKPLPGFRSFHVTTFFHDNYPMTERFVRHKKSLLHYKMLGSADRTLFIFHGFGQDHQAFQSISDTLSAHYTLFVFDLYFHGKSEWGYDEMPLEKEHWKETIGLLLEEYHIGKFAVAGFSLGGKFAMATGTRWH